MFGSNKSAILLVLQLSLCFLGAVNAVPLYTRQTLNSTSGETIVNMTTYQTDQGLMTENCTVKLMPVSGSDNMQEFQSCTVMPATSGAQIGSTLTVSGASGSSSSSSVGLNSTDPSASPTPSASSPNGTALGDNSPPTVAANNAAGPSASVTANSAAVVTPFAIPGRHILIPAYGLGLFCIVTGIGILVWAFVTYERIRYRKTFRKRKLAEQAVPMGYGGMTAEFKA